MRHLHKTFLHNFLAVLIAFFAITATAQTNFWQQTNGPFGGTIYAFAIDSSSGHIFAGTGGAGVFRSIDNGDTWCQTGLTNTTVRAVAINSHGHIFAGTNGSGVFHSADNGETWRAINTGLTNANVYALAINSSGHIFAGTNGGGVFRSIDNGVNWMRINTGLTNANVYALAINSSGHIFAGTFGGGVFRSTDNGQNWRPINNGLAATNVQALAINRQGYIFAGVFNFSGGVFRSTDNGDSWSNIESPHASVSALAINNNGHIFVGGGIVYRSTNNGRIWSRTLFLTTPVLTLVTNPATQDIFVGTNGSGAFRSTDNGASWGAINVGLINTIIQTLAINNKNGYMFAGGDGGLHLSSDNGGSWRQIPFFIYTTIRALTINGQGHIFAGLSGSVYRSIDNGEFWRSINAGLTNTVQAFAINQDGHIFAGTSGGVFRSTDNGDSWGPINAGLTNTTIRALAINNNGHIFAGTFFGGVFRSIDNGDNWSPINTGLTNLFVNALVINPATQDIFAGAFGRMFRSTNNGDNWSPTGLAKSVNALAANSQGNIFAGMPDGVSRSIDNGANWSPINTGLTNTAVLALAVNSNDIIFAGAAGGGVFRSEANRNVAVANANAPAGRTANVAIQLSAQGNENALRFSLTFDPSILSHPQARLGKDARAATLNLDSSQAASGRYGIALALPSGQRLAAGAREIMVVSFSVKAVTPGVSTTIGFGDQPICREMVSVIGAALTSTWTSGTTAITPPVAIGAIGASAAPGSMVSLPLELISQGSGNAFGFSMNFDPAILSHPQAKLGKDAGAASLNINSSQAGSGRLGIALALPAGRIFTAGTREIVVVSFIVNAKATADSTRLEFGDQPVAREVADSNGDVLPATWTGGRVAIARGFEADVAPRPNGNGRVSIADWVQVGRFAAALDTLRQDANEFQRADGAPKPCGDGRISISDWVQAGRYAAGLDTVASACGPTSAASALAPAANVDSAIAGVATKAARARAVRAINPKLQSAPMHAVTVELDAQGDENAIGFSLGFDSTVVKFKNAVLGSGASGATLNVNSNQTANGRAGIALALPAGQVFAAGTRQIVVVNFSVAPNASVTSTPIEFKDQPIAREVVEVNGNVLQATWSSIITSVKERANEPPASFALDANHPNPFNPLTTIKYDLPQQVEVKLMIFDLLGQHVRTLVNQSQPAGRYAITWDGRNEQGEAIAGGVYIYQLRAGTFAQARRMALVR